MKHAPPFEWIPRGGSEWAEGSPLAGSDLPPILRQLILQRGMAGDEDLEAFLRPLLKNLSDPFLLEGMDQAVARILRAVDEGQAICIFGDYDVDGVTSIALMKRILQAYGVEARTFIPRRSSEGYGLSTAAIERCMSEGVKPDLLITVDCGTVSVAEIAALQADGVDVVVIDHHEPLLEERPACHALVNPKCCGHLTYLCAAGVVFKLGHALLKARPAALDLRQVLDLVAVATISDIVPMVGENRLLVRHGLQRLPQTLNPGLKALQEVTRMHAHATSMD
ncbi:MAG TPA: DHH family phosphoesterase, partial [Luteolibacter sp.]|nr:DHH family phosphoesterase [Luteolibacter sp.]